MCRVGLVSFSRIFFLDNLFLNPFSHSVCIGICIWKQNVLCRSLFATCFIFLSAKCSYPAFSFKCPFIVLGRHLFTGILTFGLFLPFQSYLCWRHLYLPAALWMYLFHWNFFIRNTTSLFLYDFHGTQKTVTNHLLCSTWFDYRLVGMSKSIMNQKEFHYQQSSFFLWFVH